MKITFIGAAHEVTGSCTLLENGGKYYLVDKGMEQGVDMFENVPLPVAPEEISAVFITHAHIDHTGMLPKLYKDGYRGPVYATSATCSLCNIMLLDSAHIQESEAEWRNRKATRSGDEVVEPLYTVEDVHGLMPLFRPCRYGETIPVDDSIDIRFTDIGHLLGSACIEIWMREGETSKKIVFSGDVGNTDQPIIRDPQNVSDADYLVIESTYGDRLHESTEGIDVVSDFAAFLQRTLDRGGNVVIPAFAVGRTQELLYALREIKARGHKIFLDLKLHDIPNTVYRSMGKLAELADAGVKIFWFTGNHDVWLFDYLATEIGLKVLNGNTIMEIMGTKFLLSHGDDVGYQRPMYRFTRWCFYNRVCQWLYASIHPRWTYPIATGWSQQNRITRDHDYEQRLREECCKRLEVFCNEHAAAHPEVRHYVFGHVHLARQVGLNDGRTMTILGEWIDQFTYATFDGEKIVMGKYHAQ